MVAIIIRTLVFTVGTTLLTRVAWASAVAAVVRIKFDCHSLLLHL